MDIYTYILGYIIISIIYSIYYGNRMPKSSVSTVSILMLGTTFPLHLLMLIVSSIYVLFGVNILYVVSVNGRKKNDS